MSHPPEPPPGTPAVTAGFVRRTLAVVAIAAAATVVLLALWQASTIVLVTFGGVLLGIFLLALRDGLAHHTPLSEGWALAVVVAALLAITGLGAVLAVPPLVAQYEEAVERLPEVVERVESFLQQHAWGRQLLERLEDGGGDPGGVAAGVAGILGGALQAFLYWIAFLFIGLYVAIHPRLYAHGLVGMVPRDKRARTREVLAEIDHILRWFLVARALAMVFVGVSTGIMLTLLNVPMAFLLAVVAGMLTFIPYLGPIIAAVPITLVALVEGPDRALYTLAAYTVIEQIEGNVFEPLVLKRIVHLPPVVTVVSQLLGGALFGMLGVALATPAAAVGKVLWARVYREDVLGDPPEEEREKEEESGG
jgi:predicted PurR-regulated permease PerM